MSRLLIVDDEADVREFAANFFRKRKIDVITASSGEEAIDITQKLAPDLLLLDIKMSGLDGVETLRRNKENNKDIKVIMVTGRKPEDDTHEQCRQLGALDYIHKPLELDELGKGSPKGVILNMAVDYKKELENAAKSMILVHKPDSLIKMIVRMIVQKVRVAHAGILLHFKDEDTYVLTVSRGPAGLKIPAGFARMDKDNPLIRFFREPRNRRLFRSGAIIYDDAKKILNKKITLSQKQLVRKTLYQMEMFDTIACIPSYFHDDLLGILFLGAKKRKRRFSPKEIDFFTALASDVAMAIRNAQLFRDLELEIDKTHRLFINTTVTLAAAIDAKDHYTHNHISRVTSLSMAIAGKLSQRNKLVPDKKFMENLQIAGLLHDIGKIGIPEAILNKQGPLDDEERKKINEHPMMGVTILKPIHELGEAIFGVKYHHERFDGSGYPEGLKGEQIPLIASIISVADAFDAMVSDRPYRKALSKDAAAAEIESQSGRQFNPEVSAAFIELYQENKI